MKSAPKPDAHYLSLCKKMVEEKVGWGSSDAWSHADCLALCETISEETGISLSVTTIKRLWGKVSYDGSPSTTTLNALALYLGYENWRDFKMNQRDAPEMPEITPAEVQPAPTPAPNHEPAEQSKPPQYRKKARLMVPVLTALVLFAVVILFYSAKEKEAAPIATAEVVFTSEPLAKGIPNTVVFNYDLAGLEFDSAFIQQNWDARRRERISRNNKQHTSVYYFPGHFNAKLVINDQVVKEHGLLIPTEGWLGLIEREGYSTPVYIAADQLIENGVMHVSSSTLEAGKVDPGKDFILTYANARDFGIDGDRFTLEASVKNDLAAGGLLCQEVMVFVDGESGVMWFPLSAPGCVGNTDIMVGDVYISGKNNDLSAFGADLSQWNSVRFTVEDKTVRMYLNDQLIHTVAYTKPIGKVMGINLKFHGAGAVDYLRMYNADSQLVFEDDFGLPDTKQTAVR